MADGVQALLAAEQEAQAIIQKARNDKTSRLKQAKEEAEAEVAAYRRQREDAFKKSLEDSQGTAGTNVKKLEEETATAVAEVDTLVKAKGPELAKSLLSYTTTV